MNAEELDGIYTEFCRALGRVGESAAESFLARFALMCMLRIDAVEPLRELIAAAAEGCAEEVARPDASVAAEACDEG
ncbi:MAG: hypothetical protein KGL34_08400 [Gammaproteobacteria bacterium]|nr:hypothetical protein [Gammaproteobacteria bacterium]